MTSVRLQTGIQSGVLLTIQRQWNYITNHGIYFRNLEAVILYINRFLVIVAGALIREDNNLEVFMNITIINSYTS